VLSCLSSANFDSGWFCTNRFQSSSLGLHKESCCWYCWSVWSAHERLLGVVVLNLKSSKRLKECVGCEINPLVGEGFILFVLSPSGGTSISLNFISAPALVFRLVDYYYYYWNYWSYYCCHYFVDYFSSFYNLVIYDLSFGNYSKLCPCSYSKSDYCYNYYCCYYCLCY